MVAATIPMAWALAGQAHAESNPACGDVAVSSQPGHVVIGGQNAASVKQFKGCGKNWGYIYVWDSWKSGHPNFEASVAITTGDGDIDLNNGRRGQQEVWSDGANTLRFCTMAHGIVDRLQGFTNEVC